MRGPCVTPEKSSQLFSQMKAAQGEWVATTEEEYDRVLNCQMPMYVGEDGFLTSQNCCYTDSAKKLLAQFQIIGGEFLARFCTKVDYLKFTLEQSQ
jgi:hypothetical protein